MSTKQGYLPDLGDRLRKARKTRFPGDTLREFARRIDVGHSTLQRMEAGDLSVSLSKYYGAAQVLKLESQFTKLFELKPSLFDD
ncbi:helix-turn-helix domain-containing protein [Gilvimarinus agarilyticus]|uniref:helix-turn-helix domain-containing protein n=1 Tax=Gilvimarinus agarilyticus TaxID=679259 RepID=UPI0005A268F5|nr:helix-turn-helix transcriptional regulator [Gilvimarinus agarilyticus]